MGDDRDHYEPEIGQALFGQPWQKLDGDNTYARPAVDLLSLYWELVARPDDDSPFQNTGARFDGEKLSVHAYSWGDDDQEWNLKWRDLRASWYKHCRRGLSVSREITFEEARELVAEGMAEIGRAKHGD